MIISGWVDTKSLLLFQLLENLYEISTFSPPSHFNNNFLE